MRQKYKYKVINKRTGKVTFHYTTHDMTAHEFIKFLEISTTYRMIYLAT